MTTRNTVQRDIILNTVMSMHNHPTAEEVYDAVSEVDGHISKGTVYRNLALLSSMGRIRKIPMAGSCADRYDFNLAPHYHAVCKKCGKIVDVECSPQLNDMKTEDGFSIDAFCLIFSGECNDCGKSGNAGKYKE